MKKLKAPFDLKELRKLHAGDMCEINGVIYTARDQAHKRLAELIKSEKNLPVDLSNSVIYYCGPTPAPKEKVIGSCGPTTSARMDFFTPLLMEHGLRVMIGNLHERVKSRRLVAFDDLGSEAIYKLEVEAFPVVTAIDSQGYSIWD